ncbi:hypothetical protein GCM10023084_77540 [Streptomyces lacrimifluminis]|uniref:Uncharacterized protein n=1 Tax=Streptomyces lacrimifluminis TaxID=1500077 RepID=A0A917P9J7_9ACTN|nr:hypothetical protein GCM10012282_75950 [Streptomyces lacrimifluminis]
MSHHHPATMQTEGMRRINEVALLSSWFPDVPLGPRPTRNHHNSRVAPSIESPLDLRSGRSGPFGVLLWNRGRRGDARQRLLVVKDDSRDAEWDLARAPSESVSELGTRWSGY